MAELSSPIVILVIGLFIFLFLAKAIKIVPEDHRVYVFFLGQPKKVMGPGLHVNILATGAELMVPVKIGDQLKWLGNGKADLNGQALPASCSAGLQINEMAIVQGFQGDVIILQRGQSRSAS